MKIGIDVDGVLADFNTAFIARCIKVTGRDLFGPKFVPTTWNYPESVGYTREEVSAVWKDITEDRAFWYRIGWYMDVDQEALRRLCVDREHDVYFITARPGLQAKLQTELWLAPQIKTFPTVLITSHKGLAARTLDLDFYIDDRYENVLDVASSVVINNGPSAGPRVQTFLLDRPWNQQELPPEIRRVYTVSEFLSCLQDSFASQRAA